MRINYGSGKTEFGTGISINLSGDEVAIAIDAYLVAHRVYIHGPRTIRVNGEQIAFGKIYVDPLGYVVHNGEKYSGRGANKRLEAEEIKVGDMVAWEHDESVL